jgi:hypothetical protein
MESANEAALRATEAKKQGDLLSALEYHSRAAKLYKDVAIVIRDRSSKSEFFLHLVTIIITFPTNSVRVLKTTGSILVQFSPLAQSNTSS